MKKIFFAIIVFLMVAAAVFISGCQKSDEDIVGEVYKSIAQSVKQESASGSVPGVTSASSSSTCNQIKAKVTELANTYIKSHNEYITKCGSLPSTNVVEQVKCTFEGSSTQQDCSSTSYGAGCTAVMTKCSSSQKCSTGALSCVADISGKKGDKITWKSSCGGYAYTTMDGKGESAAFKCGQTAICPALAPIYCSNGKVVPQGNDQNGCPLPGKCVEQSVCIDVYQPVCGSDGKTYSNSCYAKNAGVSFTDGACINAAGDIGAEGTAAIDGDLAGDAFAAGAIASVSSQTQRTSSIGSIFSRPAQITCKQRLESLEKIRTMYESAKKMYNERCWASQALKCSLDPNLPSSATLYQDKQQIVSVGDIKHEIELKDITDKANACGIRIDGDVVWMDIVKDGKYSIVNGVAIRPISASIGPGVMQDNDVCRVQFYCMNESEKNETRVCTDSDGGINYYVAGKASRNWSGDMAADADECWGADGNQLKEVYCDENQDVKANQTVCPNGCKDGACMNMPPEMYINGQKNIYYREEQVDVIAKAVENDGTPAEPEEGYNIQFYTYNASNNETVKRIVEDGHYNGYYNKSTGYWYIHFNAPSDSSGYFTEMILYCSRDNTKCSNLYGSGWELKKSFDFKILPTADCNDSDGGLNYYVKGSTTGYANIPPQLYTHEDCCQMEGDAPGNCVPESDRLVENYCLEDGKSMTGVIYNCTNGCKDGACLKNATEEVKESFKCIFEGSTTEQECYSAKGRCTGIQTCGYEISGAKGEIVTWKSSCGGYANTTMDGDSEYAIFNCTPVASTTCKDEKGIIHQVGESWKSGDGCNSCSCAQSGKVVCTTIPCIKLSCTDSDKGKDYNVKGMAYNQYDKVADTCDIYTGKLVEYYCGSDGKVLNESFKCGYGCELGVCSGAKNCVDTDGGTDSQIYMAGRVDYNLLYGAQYHYHVTDGCWDNVRLSENSCIPLGKWPYSQQKTNIINCTKGCDKAKGACIR